ncbi:hypothetical protein AWB76_07227 [Caballeronia temeraria]|uniref:Holin of 3TMs, for gene-transfer release n=1 Tax=Caballeronia temeraria TaxID=1777137 RepID=A0A158DMW9_9BURK|nr:hypothetical protein [Caballeronia temeraria]SAK95959.1 hypothetical protein AWB76_07227 [Caballeronia temeraria]
MSWTAIAGAVTSLAPTIASAIGGPLAGTAVAALEKVFGLTPGSNDPVEQRQDAVAAAIAGATPEQLAAVRKADQDFQVAMATLGFKDAEALAALRVQDVEGARSMQVSTRSWVPPVLTLVITTGFFSLVAALIFCNIPESNKAIFYSLVGSLGTAWAASIHFWFGDTTSSVDKTTLLAKAQPIE